MPPAITLAGRYELRSTVAAGGMGIIYQGLDHKTGLTVAVKQMHSYLKEYPQEYERFRKEAAIVDKLNHPNIVALYNLIEQEGEIYLVFEYVEGKTLYALLKEKKRLPLEDCKKVLGEVCEAVHYAHANGVIHRDLKPPNIMLADNGKAMVMDFGLACTVRDGLTRVSHQTNSGTPAYMAPEQHTGVVKRESDVYSLGVCLYEMLTGELPYTGLDSQKQKLLKDYREAGSVLPWLPSGVDALISRALEPEPTMRFAGPLDFWDALKGL
jgi:serine/threonine protein kinase